MRRTAYPLTGSGSDYFLATPNCTGNEGNLFSCSYSVMHSGVTCNYEADILCQGIVYFTHLYSQ